MITSNPLKLAQVHTALLRRTQQFPHVVSTFCALALHIRCTKPCAQPTTVQGRCTVCIFASVAVFPSSHCFFLHFCCCLAVCSLYILFFSDLGWLFHLHFIVVRTEVIISLYHSLLFLWIVYASRHPEIILSSRLMPCDWHCFSNGRECQLLHLQQV